MSLEDKIERLTDSIDKQNELLLKIVSGKPGAGAAAEDGEKKTPTTRKKKAAAEDSSDEGGGDGDDAVDTAKLKKTRATVAEWLKEFAENEDDPENEARQEKFAAALEKLGAESISSITSEAMRARVDTWIAKQVEAGRITEEPKKKSAKKSDDDDI